MYNVHVHVYTHTHTHTENTGMRFGGREGEGLREKFTPHMCTHTHTCGDSQQMNTCCWGVGGGGGVSVGGVSQLRSDLSM